MCENDLFTLRETIELQKAVCRSLLDKYGVEHKATREALFTLGKLAFLYEKRCTI